MSSSSRSRWHHGLCWSSPSRLGAIGFETHNKLQRGRQMISWYDAAPGKAKKGLGGIAANNTQTGRGKSHRDVPPWATSPLMSRR